MHEGSHQTNTQLHSAHDDRWGSIPCSNSGWELNIFFSSTLQELWAVDSEVIFLMCVCIPRCALVMYASSLIHFILCVLKKDLLLFLLYSRFFFLIFVIFGMAEEHQKEAIMSLDATRSQILALVCAQEVLIWRLVWTCWFS